MDWTKVHVGRRAALGAALPALVVVAGISVVVLRTRANPVVRTVPVGFWTGPLVVDESAGRAFVNISDSGGGGHSRLEMLDAATGAIVRIIPIPGWVYALAVDEQTVRLVAVSTTGVRVLDSRNGALLRVVQVSPAPSTVVVDTRAGRIYAASAGTTSCVSYGNNQTCTRSDGALSVLDARTGRLLHTTTLRHQGPTTLALDGTAHRLIMSSNPPPIMASSRFGRGYGTAVSIFDTATARLVRRITLHSVVWGPPVIDEVTGWAFLAGVCCNFQTATARLDVLETHSGRLLRTIPLGTGYPEYVDVAVDERMGRVFATAFGAVRLQRNHTPVAMGAGSVRVLDAHSGGLLRTIPIGPATTAVAVDERRGRLYVTNDGAEDAAGNPVGPGNLTVLDERSGRVLRTVAVGVNPVSLTLDRRAGRLFVVNVGNYNPIRSADAWAWVPRWLRPWLPFLPPHAPAPRRIPGSVTVLDTSRL